MADKLTGCEAVLLGGERLLAMPQRTLWWPSRGVLLLSDLHLGKAEGLRRAGAALPIGSMEADLRRLAHAVELTGAAFVVILGDLVHGRLGLSERVVEHVAAWRAALSAEMHLLPGNHERSAAGPGLSQAMRAWRIELRPAREMVGTLTLTHDPDGAVGPTVAGHLHPAVKVGRRSVPAFVRRGEVLILPAFSGFTAGSAVAPGDADEVLVCAHDRIVRLGGQR